ncbi:ATP-binding protein [Butyrivibrio sp. VCD2006]|uniref:ATP-binding protein n=1 Tax=Butyrivibrio sp. VCD2006 TaxID=1280664 RepID=UPI000404B551|nr:ATP-binding protein [Butyrivibrio sp. VCD2006]
MLGFGVDKYKKSTVIAVIIIGVIVLITLASLCIITAVYGEYMYFDLGTFGIAFFIWPFLLIAGLYGYLISLIVFLISFCITLFYNMDRAYTMSIYLVAMLCFALFGQYHWFSSLKKTALVATLTLLLTSITEFACLAIIGSSDYEFEVLKNYGDFLIRESVGIIIMAFLLYLYFTKAPEHWKYPFPIAVAYTGFYKEDKDFQRGLRKTRISVKISAIIIAVEVMLGIFVAIFMIVLFPDTREMFVGAMHKGEVLKDIGGNMTEEELAHRFENVQYSLNAKAVSYDLKMLILVLCAGVPMAGIANFFIKVTIGTPLGNISDFMKEYAEADDDKKIEVGRKASQIKIKTNDEIRVVHESIKETVLAIENYINHINEEYELEKELEVAKQSSEAKSAFLSNMSHEIRTPINAVLGLNEMILRESHEDQILEYASSVKSAGNSLLGIINDILDFSKIEAGKMEILPVEYHLSSTINDLVNVIAVKAKDKGIELKMNIDSTLPTKLIGDEIRIKQCATNVLSNAVKYTEEGSITLNVTYRKADEDSIYLRFQVIDTGIGIKEEDLEKLYSPFERIEEARNRSIEGTGLGMSIVKKLLSLMDSRLEVKSVYGEGSDFSFEVKQQVASWEELGDFKEKYKEFLGSQKSYHESFTAPDAQILVVDDTPINLTVVKGFLKLTKIQIDTAESGFETLEMVKKKKYDVIFIDHRMPEMDGIETLEALKDMPDNLSLDAPCIALTANAGEGAREEYISRGFMDYLAKPLNGELLEKMLIEYLPPEKVFITTGEAYASEASEADDGEGGKKDGKESDLELLSKLQGIDLAMAEKNCGSTELLKEVVKEFLISIDPKADSIEKFAKEKDYRNYTVNVHALKSSARLIGAMELSEMAAHLEDSGNAEDENEIMEKTPQLLELFRSYNEKLAAINPESNDEELPEISPDEIEGAFSDMKELLEAFDFDTADGIMSMLSGYKIPGEYKEKYDKVRQLMAAVDRDELLKLL